MFCAEQLLQNIESPIGLWRDYTAKTETEPGDGIPPRGTRHVLLYPDKQETQIYEQKSCLNRPSKWISKVLNLIFKKFYTGRKDWPTEKPGVCSEVHIWCSLRDSETSVRVIEGSSKTEALYPKAERAQDENVKTMKWWHICNIHVTYPRQSTSQDNQHHIWRHICNTYVTYPRQSISHVKTHMQHACNMPKTINIQIKDGKRLLILTKGNDGSWCSMK